MKLRILSVGKVKDKNIAEVCKEFTKRINHHAKIEDISIKDENTQKEGLKILKHLKSNNSFNIAMSEEGEITTSRGLALLLKSRSEKITFIIGGPNGLSESVKEEANMTLSLSSLTFTHEMAKAFLLEQIYRAISIINNKQYHKE